MLQWDPPEFRLEFKNALTSCIEKLGLRPDDIQADYFSPLDEDNNHSEDVDDFHYVVTPDEACKVWLPYADDDGYDITYGGLVDVLQEALSAELVDHVECWSKNRYLLRVTADIESMAILDHYLRDSNTKAFETQNKIENDHITCSIVNGFTVFGLLITAKRKWGKHDLPVTFEEYFIQIEFPESVTRELIRDYAEAYTFELSSTVNTHLTRFPRPELESDSDDEFWLLYNKQQIPNTNNLRPLLLGKGMVSLLRLYNQTLSIFNPDVAILFFTKAIEYVTPTIVRRNLTESVQNKLSTPRALQPDADFVLELAEVFQGNRANQQDKKGMALTIMQCCDAGDLRSVSPPFLTQLVNLPLQHSKQQRNDALTKFANALSATRNEIAHAKANYKPTGEECPEDQMEQFVKLVNIAAQQVIRWFDRCPEDLRIV